jgi:UDP-GlcNAc:undecaprenyl-phosphate GlcNAc-1-phosphate transferase
MRSDTSDALLLIILCGALAGFILYNFNPATIFLGDSGSLLIGYILAVTAVAGSQKQATALAVLIPLLVFGLPILDTLLSMVRRFVGGMKIARPFRASLKTKLRALNGMFAADRSHIHHRLLAMGLSHRNAVLVLYGLSFCLALLVLLSVLAQYRNAGIILAVVCLATYVGIHKLGYEEATLFRAGTFLRWYENLAFDRRFFLGFIDIVLIATAYWGAFLLKYSVSWSSAQKQWHLETFPLVLLTQLLMFFAFKLYQGVWRAIGIGDLIHIGLAVCVGAWLSYCTAVINTPPADGTLSFFTIYCLLLVLLVLGIRSTFRILQYLRLKGQSDYSKALIYGAGRRGQLIQRELLHNSTLRLQPIGFIDDDPTLVGRRVDRLPVVGSGNGLELLLLKRQVSAVIVSSTKINEDRLQVMTDLCRKRQITMLKCSLSIEPIVTEALLGAGVDVQVNHWLAS